MKSSQFTPTLELCLGSIAQQGCPDEVGYYWGHERIEPLGDVWDVMHTIFCELGHEDAADLLADAVHAGRLTREQAAEALNYGNWAGELQSIRTCAPTLDRWVLAGDDPVRVFIALRHETYRLDAGIQWLNVLTDLKKRWPELASLCDKRRRSVIEYQLIRRNGPKLEANTLILQMADKPNSVHTVSLSEFIEAAKEKEASTSHATDSNSPLA